MTVLFVHNTSDLYGASRCMLRLCQGLVSSGNNVHVVLPEHGPLEVELAKTGAHVTVHRWLWTIDRQSVSSPKGLLWFGLRAFPSIGFMAWKILKHRATVVHTNTALILSPAFASALMHRPHVWHIREFFVEFPGFWPTYQKFMCWRSRTVVAGAHALTSQFSPGLREHVRMIHDGFPAAEFAPVSHERETRFRELNGLGHSRIVGIVGRVKWNRKGQEVFVRAAARLKGVFPDVVYVIVGSPYPGNENHLERLLALIKELGVEEQVRYTGEAEDVKAAYAAMEIVVLASTLPEPCGGVVVEAMAFGKAVVGTRCGGTVEQIEDQVTGLLFEPGDDADLAAKLRTLLGNPSLSAAMGKAGRQRYEDLFEFQKCFARMNNLYNEVAQAR